MPDSVDAPSPKYVLTTASMIALYEQTTVSLDDGVSLLGRLIGRRRVFMSEPDWAAMNDPDLRSAFVAYVDIFVVPARRLVQHLDDVVDRCGPGVLGTNPVISSTSDPWTLALAIEESATVVLQPSSLNRLPDYCDTLGVPCTTLAELIDNECQ